MPIRPTRAGVEAEKPIHRDEWLLTSERAPAATPEGKKVSEAVPSDFDKAFSSALDDAFGPREDDRAAAISQDEAARDSAEENAKVEPAPPTVTAEAAPKADQAMAALTKLFGGKPKPPLGTLGEEAFAELDPDIYAQAKPLFVNAASKFATFADDIHELVRHMVVELRDSYGWTREMLEGSKPYFRRFIEEVKAGKITREDLAGERPSDTFKGEEAADEYARTESARAEALEEVAPREIRGATEGGYVEREPAGGGEPGAGGNRPSGEERLPGTRGARGGAAAVHPTQAGARAGRPRRGAKIRAGEAGSGLSKEPASASRIEPNVPEKNFRITDELELGKGSEAQKFRDNIAAIETLKNIERDDRHATPQEQAALARYVGWGGLANSFRAPDTNEFKADWKDRGEQLEGLLTPEELRAARRTTRNAHYTSQPVIDAMWKAAERLGFKGGLALESSVGSGNFIGLIPDNLAGQTRFIGAEYDSLTARVAQALYPQETILHTGFQRLPLPDGEFTLSIGNPPFGSESLRFQNKPELHGLSIHNQFFLASLDALKPGGVHIAVVSHFLMDAQDQTARQKMAAKADLIGAIRLPDTAFKENARAPKSSTDIVMMRRRTPEEEKQIETIIAEIHQPGKAKYNDDARASARAELHKEAPWIDTDEVKDPLAVSR